MFRPVPLLVAAVLLVGCTATDEVGDSQALPDQGAASAQERFISDARGVTSFPDEDFILVAVGQDICFEIGQDGEAAARQNFSRSTFTTRQQQALFSAAQRHLCP